MKVLKMIIENYFKYFNIKSASFLVDFSGQTGGDPCEYMPPT